jgi:N-hydroxyarylamine O-acetyltransferase
LHIHDYLKRINYQGSLEPTLQTLQALHEAHMLAVPFENLDIHLGREILLDEEALWNKIIVQRRGGFCYELNGLFAWLLRALGFQVDLLSAGVAHPTGGFGPEFDHLTLLVHLAKEDWLADVGFGDSFRQPLRMQPSYTQTQEWGRYRLEREQEYWILQTWNEAWQPSYRFTLQPHILTDFTEMCHYQQTSPASHFTQRRICSIAARSGRITLSDQRLIITTGRERKEHILLTNQEQYSAALAEHFGIVL